MMKKLNPEMIILARESRGITQGKLANSIPNLNQGNLSKMEKGLMKIPNEILQAIAKELNYPVSFFYQNMDIRVNPIYYRKRSSIPKKKLLISEAKMRIFLNNIDTLLESVDIPDFNLPSLKITNEFTPEDAARRIRHLMDIPAGPIMNPIQFFERSGIIVKLYDFGIEKFDGITQFTEKQQPVLFVNEVHSNDRIRFTLGHELGHLILHIRNEESLEKDDKELENEANRFSAEFNMPELECKTELTNLMYKNLGHLKQYWKLSKQAIAYRAKALKAITPRTFEYFMVELSRSGERKTEIGNVSIDKPQLLNAIISMHRNDLAYSENDMAKILKLSIPYYKEQFETANHLRIIYN